jgi:hypothetical protein
MTQKTVHRLALPTVGAELFTYLKNVNDSEAFTASMRIKDAVAAYLKQEINSWFGVPALPELDQSLLRKLTNSMLAAGEAGNIRTLEALREIRFETTPMTQPISRETAVLKLRADTRDFRSAKGFLENNHKCINSFMKLNRSINDESIRALLRMNIEDYANFQIWITSLINYWEEKGTVKAVLRGSYVANFQKFIATFGNDLSNEDYRNLLDSSIRSYLSADSLFISSEQPADSRETSPRGTAELKSSVFVHLHINEAEIELEATFEGYTKLQLSSLRIKLALSLQKHSEFSNLKLVVSMGQGDAATSIFVRTKTELSESQIMELTNFLENEFTYKENS